jgi:hypothetical protein
MSCEESQRDFESVAHDLRLATGELQAYASQYLERMRTHPLMLVGGEAETLRRYTAEIERLAREQRAMLERYLASAMQHQHVDHRVEHQ